MQLIAVLWPGSNSGLHLCELCIDQTSAQIFYVVSAAENLLIFGANVSNAFSEAPPPKQGFYIHHNKAVVDWWINHKQRDLIPPSAVIPVLLTMLGHPESPGLWEKHANASSARLAFSQQHMNFVSIQV
jgi:hypothetical protein